MMPQTLNRQINEVDLILAGGNVDLLLDFSQCNFISVDGLEWLEELLLRAESANAQVSLKNVQPPVYKVFKVARIDSISKACGSKTTSAPVC